MGLIYTDIEQTQAELETKKSALEKLDARLTVVEKDLEGYDTEGYDHFKANVLPAELDRLAHLRMDLPVDDLHENTKCLGQYLGVKRLLLSRGELERERDRLMIAKGKMLNDLIRTEAILKKAVAKGKASVS